LNVVVVSCVGGLITTVLLFDSVVGVITD